MRTAVVAGATGLVGGLLLGELLAAREEWSEVVALVRRPCLTPRAGLREAVVDFGDGAACEAAIPVGSVVFCCLGTTIKRAGSEAAFRVVDVDYPVALARAAARRAAAQLVVVSALGADPRSGVFYNRAKGEMEEGVRAAGVGVTTIVRPSLLLGDRAEFRLGERVAAVVAVPLGVLLVGRLAKYRPIPARAVARAMVALARDERGGAFESDALAALGR